MILYPPGLQPKRLPPLPSPRLPAMASKQRSSKSCAPESSATDIAKASLPLTQGDGICRGVSTGNPLFLKRFPEGLTPGAKRSRVVHPHDAAAGYAPTTNSMCRVCKDKVRSYDPGRVPSRTISTNTARPSPNLVKFHE